MKFQVGDTVRWAHWYAKVSRCYADTSGRDVINVKFHTGFELKGWYASEWTYADEPNDLLKDILETE